MGKFWKVKEGEYFTHNSIIFYCDTEDDIDASNEQLTSAPEGSRIYCLENSSWYIKNGNETWVRVKKTLGTTFTPKVSNGVLEWSNDGGLANPKEETIKGPTGSQGPEGKSAYQLWVEQPENTGKSKEDFFQSLIGEEGVGISEVTIDQKDRDGESSKITFTLTNNEKYSLTVKNGTTGSTGSTGPKGDKGDKGDKGGKGDKGDKGETGESLTVEKITQSEGGQTLHLSDGEQVFIPNGIGIYDVETLETSIEDRGKNKYKMILTDGTAYTFEVYNGSKGSTGSKGAKGDKGEKGDQGEGSVSTDQIIAANSIFISGTSEGGYFPEVVPPQAVTTGQIQQEWNSQMTIDGNVRYGDTGYSSVEGVWLEGGTIGSIINTYGNLDFKKKNWINDLYDLDGKVAHDFSYEYTHRRGTSGLYSLLEFDLKIEELPDCTQDTGDFPDGRNGFIIQFQDSMNNLRDKNKSNNHACVGFFFAMSKNPDTGNVRLSFIETDGRLDEQGSNFKEHYLELPSNQYMDGRYHRYSFQISSLGATGETQYTVRCLIDGVQRMVVPAWAYQYTQSIAIGAKHTSSYLSGETQVDIGNITYYPITASPRGGAYGVLSSSLEKEELLRLIRMNDKLKDSFYSSETLLKQHTASIKTEEDIKVSRLDTSYYMSMIEQQRKILETNFWQEFPNGYSGNYEASFNKCSISHTLSNNGFYPYFWTNSCVYIPEDFEFNIFDFYHFAGMYLNYFVCISFQPNGDGTYQIHAVETFDSVEDVRGFKFPTIGINQRLPCVLIDMTNPTTSSSKYMSENFGSFNRAFYFAAEYCNKFKKSAKFRFHNIDSSASLGIFRSRKDPNVDSKDQDHLSTHKFIPEEIDGVKAQDYFKDFKSFSWIELDIDDSWGLSDRTGISKYVEDAMAAYASAEE